MWGCLFTLDLWLLWRCGVYSGLLLGVHNIHATSDYNRKCTKICPGAASRFFHRGAGFKKSLHRYVSSYHFRDLGGYLLLNV